MVKFYTKAGVTMIAERTVSLSFRVTPSFARLLERAAFHENRSKTNLVETLVLQFCRECGIDGQAGAEEPVVKPPERTPSATKEPS